MPEEQETAGNLFRAGKLTEAVAAANAAVRKSASDIAARVLLAELLLFSGNLERADVILDAARDIEPEAAIGIAEFRQLLRAETARRQLRRDGRVPEFLSEPTESLAAVLEALVALRAGDQADAGRKLAAAESLRPHIAGSAAGQAFDDFRDADDLCAGYFEVLTTTGRYYWIPTEAVEQVQFHPPKRPRDLFWRRASVSVRAGPDGDVYIPAIYYTDDAALDGALRLGRATDWRGEPDGPVIGVGQRIFLAGEESLPILSATMLDFSGASEA